MPNVVRTTLLITTLSAQQRFTCFEYQVSLIQILSDLEHIDRITEMCLFPGYETFVKNTSAPYYLDSVNFRISPETGVWLLKLVSILCCWRPSVEPKMSLWVRGTRHSRAAGTSACDGDTRDSLLGFGRASYLCSLPGRRSRRIKL